MELYEFVQNFADLFDETDASLITAETRFRDLEEWSSLIGLSVIAMADDEYDVTLTADEFRKCVTVKDVYNIVLSKQ